MEPDGYKSIAESYVKYKEPEKSFFDQVLEAKPDPNARKGNTVAIKIVPAMPLEDIDFNTKEEEAVDKALKALMENAKIMDYGTRMPKPRVKRLCGFCLDPRCKFSEK